MTFFSGGLAIYMRIVLYQANDAIRMFEKKKRTKECLCNRLLTERVSSQSWMNDGMRNGADMGTTRVL